MKLKLLIFFIFLSGTCVLRAGNNFSADTSFEEVNNIVRKMHFHAMEIYSQGDYIESERLYEKIIAFKERMTPQDSFGLARIYVNMGNMYSGNWNFTSALKFYEKAENIYNNEEQFKEYIGIITTNKGNILSKVGDPIKAISYYEQALKIFYSNETKNNKVFFDLYYNLATAEIYRKRNDESIYYIKNASRFIDNKTEDLNSLYTIYSKAYLNLNQFEKANYYFNKLLDLYKNEKVLYKIYIYIGVPLIDRNINPEKGLKYLNYGLDLYEKYNINSPITKANAFEGIAIYYENKKEYHKALRFYQKSIILTSNNFTDTAISSNPVDFTNIYEGRSIYSLEGKARVLLECHKKYGDSKYLKYALNSILKAIEIINRIRYRYTSDNSSFLISERGKQTFDLAEHLSFLLYSYTGKKEYLKQGFEINEMGRAYSLLSSIKTQRATEYGEIPAKILSEEKDFQRKISLFEDLILQEGQVESPDNNKISSWQTTLFNLERDYEKFTQRLEKEFKGYYSLKYDTNVTGIDEIEKKISANTALIQYSILDTTLLIYYSEKKNSGMVSVKIEPGFEEECTEFFNIITKQSFSKEVKDTYKNYSQLGYKLYKLLINPIEDKIIADNLIIIPDGRISYVPFDALLTKEIDSTKLDYRNAPFLIKNYSTGYSYSSTLHFNPIEHNRVQNQSVLAFAPTYSNLLGQEITLNLLRNIDKDRLLTLPGVKEEVKKISKIVETDSYLDNYASEYNFKKYADRYRILHLAMHTLIDDENPMMSKLAFTQSVDTTEDNFLHTYEIYNMKFNASLAVLSSCSSGYGTFQEGEGIQSLARSFAYAGCPSILMTLWEVSDFSTVFVMNKFYTYLKEHQAKPEALRKAKMDFLADADQLRSNPFFWSSYVIIGDSSPIYPFKTGIILTNILLLVAPLGYIGIINRKYRKANTNNVNKRST